MTTRNHGKVRVSFYACATFHRKGHTVCANNAQVLMTDADWAVMEVVQDELLDPVVVETALREALSTLLHTPDALTDRVAAMRTRVKGLDDEIARLTDAIAAGADLGSVVTALKQREHDRRRCTDEARHLEALIRAGGFDADAIRAQLARRVQDWRALAAKNVAHGRQILRKLLQGRVRLTPRSDGRVELAGTTDYGKLFSGIVLATALASPPGFDTFRQSPSHTCFERPNAAWLSGSLEGKLPAGDSMDSAPLRAPETCCSRRCSPSGSRPARETN